MASCVTYRSDRCHERGDERWHFPLSQSSWSGGACSRRRGTAGDRRGPAAHSRGCSRTWTCHRSGTPTPLVCSRDSSTSCSRTSGCSYLHWAGFQSNHTGLLVAEKSTKTINILKTWKLIEFLFRWVIVNMMSISVTCTYTTVQIVHSSIVHHEIWIPQLV